MRDCWDLNVKSYKLLCNLQFWVEILTRTVDNFRECNIQSILIDHHKLLSSLDRDLTVKNTHANSRLTVLIFVRFFYQRLCQNHKNCRVPFWRFCIEQYKLPWSTMMSWMTELMFSNFKSGLNLFSKNCSDQLKPCHACKAFDFKK